MRPRRASIEPGSSPLTRGKRGASRAEDDFDGLIPAHAGKTRCVSASSTRARAHPRSRGENKQPQSEVWREQGSSPLTRGKLLSGCVVRRLRGLIPAHAGKTGDEGSGGVRRGAHPRSRGENTVRWSSLAWCGGSSPLTRGKRYSTLLRRCTVGLIPAHAGKTSAAVWDCG